MHLLISNDDGVNAAGINCLADKLGQHHDITVVAPDRDMSGTSSALTLSRPVQLIQHSPDRYSTDGTPADCVQLGANGGLAIQADMVVSGINHGPNLGDDVIYSGTVAAALEGRSLSHPAIAISLVGQQHFATAAEVAKQLIDGIAQINLPANCILNVNVPDIPYLDLQGMQLTRLGQRHPSAPVIDAHDPRGRQNFWLGSVGAVKDASVGTDFYAIANNYVSITVLSPDMAIIPSNSHQTSLSSWLSNWSVHE